jgi:hypothetical protein
VPWQVDSWNIEKGLPNNSVTAIAQTLDGFLWIGTDNGLARFDGQNFRSFSPQNTPGVASTRVEALCADDSGGLWIDHKKTVIVLLIGKMEQEKIIESKIEKQLKRYSNLPNGNSSDSRQMPAEDAQERDFIRQLNIYYDEVIAFIKTAESIFIFGPGEAKLELKKRIEKKRLSKRIAGIEAADKMTNPQVAVKVRKYFLKKLV